MLCGRPSRHRSAKILYRIYVPAHLALLVASIVSVAPQFAAPAIAAPVCRAAEPMPPIAELPWAQRWLQPDRVWPLATGRGVTVAVLDSGVDAGHPQLRDGPVLAGVDMVTNAGPGNVDCDSHGTAVGSILAARPARGIGFAGLAPGASLLPVRVVEQGVERAPGEEPPVSPSVLATALRWAADQGAHVINVSVVFYVDHQVIADAVRHAQSKGAIVVAAVGNAHDEQRSGPDAVPYPAAYSGVVGVGAMGPDGSRLSTSYVGPHVDLVAPGGNVTAAARLGGHRQDWTGASFAAPFVSAAAALLVSADSSLSAAQVIQLLYASADPPGGSREEYGHGVVNPYRALTERYDLRRPAVEQSLPEPVDDPRAGARERRWHLDGRLAGLVTVAATALAMLALLAGSVWRRGRRDGWRPARRASRTPACTAAEAADPARVFFTVPAPPGRPSEPVPANDP
jgi:membrane-anchored mycosin MYCP